MAGYSAGAIKTSYIFNQAPEYLRGAGIIGGSIGNLASDKISRMMHENTAGWLDLRAMAVRQKKIVPASAFKDRYVYLAAGLKDRIVPLHETNQTARFFKALGAKVEFETWDFGHVVPSIAKGAGVCGKDKVNRA